MFPGRAVSLVVTLTLAFLVALSNCVPITGASYNGNSKNPTNVTANAVLAPPTLLTASISGNSIILNWTATASTWATGYVVYRSTTAGSGYAQIGSNITPYTNTTYTDSTATPGVAYYYVLRSYYQSWTSAFSNEATGTVPAPIALIQSATGIGSTVGTITATFPNFPTQNNLLVAIAGTYENAALTAPAGWSVAINPAGTAGFPSQAIFYKVAGAGESKTVNVTTAATTNATGIQIFEYSNIATTSPLDVTRNQLTVSPNPSTGTLTTTNASDLIIVGMTVWNASTISSFTNSFTQRTGFAGPLGPYSVVFGSADRVVSATGGYSTVATTNAGSNPNGREQIVAFKHK